MSCFALLVRLNFPPYISSRNRSSSNRSWLNRNLPSRAGSYVINLSLLLLITCSLLNVTNAHAQSKPGNPVNVTPESGAWIAENAETDFVWQVVPGATSYDFHFYNRATAERTFTLGLDAAEICDEEHCSIQMAVDLPVAERHIWYSRAINAAGGSGWSKSLFDVIPFYEEAPTPPLLSVPAPGGIVEEGKRVKFQWQPSETAYRYDFSLLDPESGVEIIVNNLKPSRYCTDAICTFWFEVDLPVSSSQVWRLRAVNSAGASVWSESLLKVFPLATAKPTKPQVVLPANGSSLNLGDEVTFTWEPSIQATTYEFRTYDRLTAERIIQRDIDPELICTAELCSMPKTIDLSVHDNHLWYVRGRNSLGVSSWSYAKFHVVEPSGEAPATPIALAPAANTELALDEPVVFSWTPVDNAASYDFQVVDGTGTASNTHGGLAADSHCAEATCSTTISLTAIEAGSYSWQVSATNDSGSSGWSDTLFSIVEQQTDQPPVASFVASVSNGVAPLVVSFDASASTDDIGITSFSWQFGEEDPVSADDLLTIQHTFDTPGIAAVSLTVTDTSGQQHTDSLDITITENQAPVAAFEFVNVTFPATAPHSVTVDPASSTDDQAIVSYQWDFGDGSDVLTLLDQQAVEHTYQEAGTYTLQLTVYDAAAQSSSSTQTVTVTEPVLETIADSDAARLLTQTTFGTTLDDITLVKQLGYEGWIDNQLQLQGPPHYDYVLQHSNGSNRWPRHEIWWGDAIDGEDQLRQRMAFALSQIFVISDTSRTLANAQYGVTNYYDKLREHAFGNYRELLETVTLSPIMGIYLSMLQNAKGDASSNTRADENYAREVLQLFSIGLHTLNADGSSTGTPAFTQQHVEEFARVFTGWNYKDAGQWNRRLFSGQDLNAPMEPFEEYHDTGSKSLLNGVVAPAGLGARADLELALDNIANHPNVGPFIGKQLIQKLVTSNPSPGYVSRVTAVFNDNGSGVRGDLGAVLKSILLDPEARDPNPPVNFGKTREPLLRLTHLWRAFNVQRGTRSSERGEYNTFSPNLDRMEEVTGQAPLRANSVFNFFQPGYSPSGMIRQAGMVAPEFEILTENNMLATSNRISRQIHRHYKSTGNQRDIEQSYLDFTYEISIAGDAEALLDHLDLLLLSGQMSDGLRNILVGHVEALPDTEDGRGQRVRDAVSLIMASPEYAVQR